MIASKKSKRVLTWAVMLAMIVSLFASFPAYVQAATPKFLGVVGARDPKATPIRTAQELANINYDLNGNYYLANDIDLAGVSNWTPIGDDEEHPFTGKFDGQGHVIKNMKVLVDQTKMNVDPDAQTTFVYAGLFGFTKNAEIKNTGVMNGKVTSMGAMYAGGIVGRQVTNTATPISNCFFTGEIQITPCYYYAYVGGIVGEIGADQNTAAMNNADKIVDCYNEGKITVSLGTGVYQVSSGIGGIAGNSKNLTMKNCYNKGDIILALDDVVTGSMIGGLVGGTNNLYATDCYNAGKINAKASGGGLQLMVGGLSGFSNQTIAIDKCYNMGSIKTTLTNNNPMTGNHSTIFTGGLLGQGSHNPSYSEDESLGITNSYNKGSITAEIIDEVGLHTVQVDTGGIVGQTGPLYIKNTYNNGNVSSTYQRTLGKIGEVQAPYFNHTAAGGIIGTVYWAYSPAKLVDCYNVGNVEAKSRNDAGALAGGLVGYLDNVTLQSVAKIEASTCYNAGTVKASCTNGTTTESEPIGKYSRFGGLLGYGKTGTYEFSSCYYLKPAKGQAVGDRYGDSGFENVKALTLAQTKIQASFVGFDFKNTWKMSTNAGYPVISVR